MKKELFIILLLIPLLSAIEITLTKESHQPQETLQATFTGNFVSLTKENIFIYKDNKVHSEPVLSDLTKQNRTYYHYALLPNQEGNYSLRIENAMYFERGKIKTETIEKNFTLLYKNTSDLSINPGFVIPEKDFSIKVKSLYKDTTINANFEATGETKTIFLIEGVEETISFNIPENIPPSLSKLTINNYEIPVFLIKKSNETQEEKIEFIPFELTGTIITNREYSFSVIIKNTGNINLTNITLESKDAVINPKKILFLEPDSIKIINITIKTNKSLDSFVEAIVSDSIFVFPFYFNVTTNESEVNFSDEDKKNGLKQLGCKEIGNICPENFICNGETIGSLEGGCCLADCVEEKSSSSKTIVGIILIILILLLVLYSAYKIRQRRKLKSAEDILKEKSDRYSQRLKGEEVSGRLDKI
ncbi:hypothetical protein J4221_06350 [Candidatus Pacearchaeota archaeon]|nr:hypothetical protein [Candidatus Pacearchaeota archaeon]